LQLTVIFYALILGIWISFANVCLQLALVKWGIVNNRLLFTTIVPLIIVVILGAILIFGLFLTNRIAGPMYRLKVRMEELADGKSFEELEIRKNDYFSELVIPYNKLVTILKEKGSNRK